MSEYNLDYVNRLLNNSKPFIRRDQYVVKQFIKKRDEKLVVLCGNSLIS